MERKYESHMTFIENYNYRKNIEKFKLVMTFFSNLFLF